MHFRKARESPFKKKKKKTTQTFMYCTGNPTVSSIKYVPCSESPLVLLQIHLSVKVFLKQASLNHIENKCLKYRKSMCEF